MRKETKPAGAAQCAKRHVTTLLSYALYKWRMVNTDRVKAQFIEYCCSLKKLIYLLLQLYWKERKIQCRKRRTIGSRAKKWPLTFYLHSQSGTSLHFKASQLQKQQRCNHLRPPFPKADLVLVLTGWEERERGGEGGTVVVKWMHWRRKDRRNHCSEILIQQGLF